MKRSFIILLSLVAALTLSLFLIDFHIAHTEQHVDSEQTIGRASAAPAPVGNRLVVYLTGDRTLASRIKEPLAAAIRAKELGLDELRFVDALPDGLNQNPFLAIRLDEDRGFWTPLYATRHLGATLLFAQGSLVDRNALAAPVTAFSETTCLGECSQGRRTIELNATVVGLTSLPHIRRYAAEQVAKEAAVLVAAGLPAHMSPERWADRAGTLARERLGPMRGSFASFQRVPGCRGGAVLAGGVGEGAPWSLMFYDAARDEITGVVTSAQVAEKRSGRQTYGIPGFGIREGELALYLDGGAYLTLPAGTCDISGWQVESR